jgi:RNA polymerase sigma-70 factor (ECF subfamily)
MLAVAELEQLPVQQARTGEPAAWDVLFRRYQLPLYVYVFELVHNEQASLDVVQEVFIKAARYIQTLRDDAKFGSWLFGIAHQQCAKHWREHIRTETLLREAAEASVDDSESPEEFLVREEQQAEFMTLLNDLPAVQRSVLLLHYIEDFSLEEIASITESQIGTVKSRLHYAKKSLRNLLKEKNENS